MKTRLVMVLIVISGLLFIMPDTSSARWRGGVGFHAGWGSYTHYGWARPRVYVGTTYVNPWYVSPVYVNPPPVVYTQPVPPPAYAYPDPAFVDKYKEKEPPGEWVAIPGQWIEGKWVPPHKSWVPVNP